MNVKTTVPFLWIALASAVATPVLAAECQQNLKWTDATFAQRDTVLTDISSSAEIRSYSNGMVASMTIKGATARMLRMNAKGDQESIYFTEGPGKPKPSDFSEISMLVEPPMTHGWPRFAKPCALPDKVAVPFDERDLPVLGQGPKGKMSGTIERDGAQLKYSLEADSPPPQGRGMEKWQGVVDYSRQLTLVPMQMDIQGWHMWRGNTFVRTLAKGKPVTVASVLAAATPGKRAK